MQHEGAKEQRVHLESLYGARGRLALLKALNKSIQSESGTETRDAAKSTYHKSRSFHAQKLQR